MLNGLAYCRMLYEGDRPVDFIYLSVNQAFGAQTGLQDVVGHRVSEVIPGIREADPELFEIYGRVARGGPPETFETYVEALQMWFEISIYSPKPEHFVAVFDVITERKLAEMALRSSEERFATVFQASPVGIVISKGYSSLAYLRRFPIDTLKIDQSFMRDIPHDESAIEITKTIIALGQNLHMQVLAEGVETEAQFRFLKSLSCNLSQGNLHSRPVVAAALADFLANNR
ncbi:EAL domain-containing protein [Paludibacterium purpuratum]|uniref:EAL domain-containing protein n=2 Tax=Paludibacterium purpuratum TaxID=1144873 RepID=A0A4R7B5P2_9NEIS|nr:EAL domain-containing protein [Paludibacterium purpuratum]